MSLSAFPIEQVLLAGLQHGTAIMPAAAQRAMRECATWPADKVAQHLELLGNELDQDFSFIRLFAHAAQISDEEHHRWLAALRATVDELGHGAATETQTRILLSCLGILGHNVATLREIAGFLQDAIDTTSLAYIIATTELDVWQPYGQRQAKPLLEDASGIDNFESLIHIQRNIMSEWRLDVAVAIVLVFAGDAAVCASAVEHAPSMLTTLLALHVLEREGLALALAATSPAVKFLALYGFRDEVPRGSVNPVDVERIEGLILQASRSPAWRAWLRALRLPTDRSSVDGAIARALHRMKQEAWQAFVEEISLAYSTHSAQPMAALLTEFERHASPKQAQRLWQMIYERWNAWNYGLANPDTYHGAIPETAFDFPVAKHYAAAGEKQREAEFETLTARVYSLEDTWFASQSDLLTTRNVLRARLRLIDYGRLLAADPRAPAPRTHYAAGDVYSVIRYRTSHVGS